MADATYASSRTERAVNAAPDAVPTDALYADQWHFDFMGNGGGRGYIETIWNEYSGAGIKVGIYDSGVQSAHPDLDGNYDPSLHVVIDDLTISGETPSSPHGTAVAGIIGAEKDNGGVVGIAWGASLTSVNIFDSASAIYINAADFSDFLLAVRQMANFDVVNNSWGAYPGFFSTGNLLDTNSFSYKCNLEFEYAVENGRGGLGTIIVKSAGNDNLDSNGDGLNSSRFTITVNALLENGFAASYSSYGASTLVSAAGGDTGYPTTVNGTRLITTTDLLGTAGYNTFADKDGAQDYTDRMNGTSAAGPMVTAVVALMLDANENLGWRDVQDILALTAFRTGSLIGAGPGLNENDTWFFNGVDNWNGGGMHFSRDYGFGNIDVFGAVRMAEAFALMGDVARTSANESVVSSGVVKTNLSIPDNNPIPQTFTFNIASDLTIEHIDLTLALSHAYAGDVAVWLTSPEGTTVQVKAVSGYQGSLTWVFGIEAFRGESLAGDWTVSAADLIALDAGTLTSVTLEAYGSAVSADDVYHYTDEFVNFVGGDPSRGTLTDSDGGVDWINLAAVSTNVVLNLNAGVASPFGITIALGTLIENVITGDGNDGITGNSAINTIYGMRGNDTLDGGDGADKMFGGVGDDTYVVDDANDKTTEALGGGTDLVLSSVTRTLSANLENLFLTGIQAINGAGNTLANTLQGNAAANVLNGAAGNDVLIGGKGVDTLKGGEGLDTLTGGAGADKFVFNLAASLSNKDIITDFTHRSDKIQLENSVFDKLGAAGGLAAAAFWVGAGAHDASDRVIYNSGTGALYYDANGSGIGQKVLIATLDVGLALSAIDFQVI